MTPGEILDLNLIFFAIIGLAFAILIYVDYQKSKDQKKKKDN